MKEIRDIIHAWERDSGKPFALATLVRAWGSSYRRPGARMLISRDGKTVGSLSGGCLEEEVALRAQKVIQTGQPCLMKFDTRLRFGCNGLIEIFVEPLRDKFLADLAGHREVRRSCFAVTTFAGNSRELGSRVLQTFVGEAAGFPGDDAVVLYGPGAEAKMVTGVFSQKIEPPIQIILVGGGPDSVPFRALSELLGWQMVEVANASELPENVDGWTAAIVKTHNYGRDFAALQALLPLGLRYVGLIGPRRRRDQLLADLFDTAGPISTQFFAPAGLDLGAETPEEIVLAIVAEIQSVLAAASGESLRDRKVPIHFWPESEPGSVVATR